METIRKGAEGTAGEHLYLGVDVAGASNTWLAGLRPNRRPPTTDERKRWTVAVGPRQATLEEIVALCREKTVAAVAIDAQLTLSLEAETGFRACDRRLKKLLPADCRNWVSSVNSLMAVPVRGQMLADHVAPYVGTILETHPRASLLLGLGENHAKHGWAVRAYKKKGERRKEAIATLWAQWTACYGINDEHTPAHDGELDAVVCATVAAPQFRRRGQTGTQMNLNSTIVRNILVSVPELDEQQHISRIIDRHFRRLNVEEAYRDKLQQVKRGLMQDLLTGRVRV